MTDSDTIKNTNWALAFSAWLIAGVSALGSLFFSEVMGFAPCSLCWYQRIFMFPLVVVLLVGMFPPDRSVTRYALPLALIGCGLALYHTLLYSGIIPESLAPCTQGVSCKETYLDLFGFLTIPLMSLISFSTITGILLVLLRRQTK